MLLVQEGLSRLKYKNRKVHLPELDVVRLLSGNYLSSPNEQNTKLKIIINKQGTLREIL